jgi:hypothetical protein
MRLGPVRGWFEIDQATTIAVTMAVAGYDRHSATTDDSPFRAAAVLGRDQRFQKDGGE